jgi:hypothetical protein
MVLGSAVVLVVAAAVLFTLFVRKQDLPALEPLSPTRHLEERKAAIYENLRDLQFEYRVGKLSDADYQQTKLGLQRELAGVIAQIEQVEKQPATAAAAPPPTPKPRPEIKCRSCGAVFTKPMKFCGECGKAMS